MDSKIIFRSRFGFGVGLVICAMCLSAIVLSFVSDFQDSNSLIAVTVAGISIIICLLTVILPKVVLTSDEITVRNPFAVHRIPLGLIENAHTRYGLVLELSDGKKISAWGAPPPSTRERFRTRKTSGRELPRELRDIPLRASDLPGSLSGDALIMLRRYQAESQSAGASSRNTKPCWLDIALFVCACALVITAVVVH